MVYPSPTNQAYGFEPITTRQDSSPAPGKEMSFETQMKCDALPPEQSHEGMCAEFRRKFPYNIPRNRLFDAHCSIHRTPLTVVPEYAPVELAHLVKSHQVFADTAVAIEQYKPEIIADRNLTTLYPGSGTHISPILIAERLMDRDKIDEAHFVYTDLNPNLPTELLESFKAVKRYQPNLYDQISIDGNTLTLQYHGKKIVFHASVRKADEVKINYYGVGSSEISEYFYPDEFRDADLIIIHDLFLSPKDGVRDLMRLQRNINDHKARVVLTNDDFDPRIGLGPTLTHIYPTVVPYDYATISGPFGCSSDAEIGSPVNPHKAAIIDLDSHVIVQQPGTLFPAHNTNHEPLALAEHFSRTEYTAPQKLKLALYIVNEARAFKIHEAMSKPIQNSWALVRQNYQPLFTKAESELKRQGFLKEDESLESLLDLPHDIYLKRILQVLDVPPINGACPHDTQN